MVAGEADAATSSTKGNVDHVDSFFSAVEKASREKEEAPAFAEKALFLPASTFPRKQCIAIVSNPYFDHFILVLIALNCITMMVFNEPVLLKMIESNPGDFDTRSLWAATDRNVPFFKPLAGCSLSDRGPCSIAQWTDFVFLLLFAVEMALKIVALGLCAHKNAYFCSAWNWLDAVVVSVGFIEMFNPTLPGVSTIRLVKTLRPLRSVQRIRGMRVLVQCILKALPQMCRVLVCLFLFIFFFALIGVSLFKNGLRYTCHTDNGDGTWSSTDSICQPHCSWTEDTVRLQGECKSLGANTFQSESFDPINQWGWVYSCRAGQQCLCTHNGLPDPTCDYRSNPNHGITSFDSMPWAIISLFQAISLEGWVDMMYQLQDGVSSWVWVYFVALVLFGAIIILNLFLAVLCDEFEMADRDDPQDEEEEDDDEVVAAEVAKLQEGPSVGAFRKMILTLLQSPYFEYFVQACIIINTLIMTLRYSEHPKDHLTLSVDMKMIKTDYMPAALFWFMFWMNIVLTAIFTLESALKIVGFGPRIFVKSKMNVFDFVVVAVSIFEIAIDPNVCGTDELSSIVPLPVSVLRAFRCFRLFKLARSVGSIRKILSTLAQSMASVFYLAMLLLLMVLIFILLGMDLFGGYYPRPELNYTADYFPDLWNTTLNAEIAPRWEDEASRYHFDDPGNACLAIFVVLSGENWNEIMFHTHAATWDANKASSLPLPYAIIYFIGLFFLGNLLLFNLFIAILLSNFEDDEEEEEEGEGAGGEDEGAAGEGGGGKEGEGPTMEWKFNGYLSSSSNLASRVSEPPGLVREPTGLGSEEDEDKPPPLFPTSAADSGGDHSLMVFSWQNPIRVACARTIAHPYFEAFIVILILVSTMLMLLDMPSLSEKHWSRVAIEYTNTTFAIIFLIEMLLKWVACGVVKSKTPSGYALSDAYFRGSGAGWNVLDFAIVVISMLMLFFKDVDALRPLRAFRAFRPLRLVQRYEDLKITVATLFMSVPAMGSLISVAALFFLIFGILGVELYGGKLGYCMDPDYADLPYGSRVIPGMNKGQTDYEECMALPRYNISRVTTHGIPLTDMADMFPNAEPNWLVFTEFPQWFYPNFGHYDNLIMSVGLLFEISALEGWPDVMHVCMDTDQEAQFVVPWKIASDQDGAINGMGGYGGVDLSMGSNVHVPQTGITAVFFIAWIIIGCFVVINMTVGIVCDTFSQIKAENDGLLLMSEDAADWVKAQKMVFAQRPMVMSPAPKQEWRVPVYHLVTSTKFDVTIMIVILLNVLQMGCDFWEPQLHEYDTGEVGGGYGAPNAPDIVAYKQIMSIFNWIFLAIYIVEMVTKWIGLGIVTYLKNPADLFDFVLVLVSTIEAVLSLLPEASINVGFVRVLRLFRVIRIIRVVKTAKQLRTIVMTVVISVPQLKNILVLITLLIIVTDVLCVTLFSFVNYTPGNLDWTADHAESIARGEVMPDPDSHYYFSGDGTNWGDMINRHANFQYFWTGMLVLVRSSTGESFNGIMHDLYGWYWGDNRMKCCPECGPMLDGDKITYDIVRDASGAILPGETLTMIKPEDSCGQTPWAFVIYFVFQNAMAYIVLSIMIGIILENFTQVGSEASKIRLESLQEFRELWLKFDPKGTYIMPSSNLLAFLQQLKQPLGLAGATPSKTRAEMLRHLGQLDIPDHGGYVHFTETLTAVCNLHAGLPVPVCESTKKMQKSAQHVPALKKLDAPEHNALTGYLASYMQSRWRGYALSQKEGGVGGGAPGEMGGAAGGEAVKKSQVAPAP